MITEIAAPIVAELLLEVGLRGPVVSGKSGANLQLLALASIGLVAGGASRKIHPAPVLPLSHVVHFAFPFVVAIGAGLVMHWVGKRRSRNGQSPTMMASFWGGAALALCYGLVRMCADARL